MGMRQTQVPGWYAPSMTQQAVSGFVQHVDDISLSTKGEVQIEDLSGRLMQIVAESGVTTGQCLLFTVSSTSAITVIEYEPGLLRDLPEALDRLFPRHGEGVEYGHEEAWQDGNGHSHIRASMLKPDLVVPVRDGKPLLGTWQQVVFVELDNKPRKRQVAVHVWGSP
jgi:secondary thiamine-phosphate synthase enzyme